MSEAESGALFVFDVMAGCHRNIGVAQHFASGGQPIAGVVCRFARRCDLEPGRVEGDGPGDSSSV
jgi:hypothetical protein